MRLLHVLCNSPASEPAEQQAASLGPINLSGSLLTQIQTLLSMPAWTVSQSSSRQPGQHRRKLSQSSSRTAVTPSWTLHAALDQAVMEKGNAESARTFRAWLCRAANMTVSRNSKAAQTAQASLQRWNYCKSCLEPTA